MMRRSFTLLEMLLVLGVLSVIGGIATPTYRDYRIRSDLHIAAEQVSQALSRARILAQTGTAGQPWGFSVPQATIFAGKRYAERMVEYDELFALPGEIALSGLGEVTFSPLEGVPSVTGSIILTSLRNEQAEVSVLIERQGIVVSIDDKLTICHCEPDPPLTLHVPEAAWPAHSNHGDYLGECHAPDPRVGCSNE